MKKTNVIILLVILFAFGNLKVNAEWIYKVPDCKKSNCGKIIGQIYDAQTKEKVKEEFFVYFLDCSEIDEDTGDLKFHYCMKTKKNGYILGMMPEGNYYVMFVPCAYETNYSIDSNPQLSPENAQKIVIKREQITKIKKLAKKGGKIKITLVDSNNVKFDPRTVFKNNFTIKATLTSLKASRWIPAFSDSSDRKKLDDGEMIVPCLPPAIYDLFVEFEDLGFGLQTVKDINVERNQISEVKILFDLNDKTGIFGYISDENKIPLPNIHVRVELSKKEISFIRNAGSIWTDENGYFKIISLKDGIYKLFIYGKFNEKTVEKSFQDIVIKNGIMIKKDITVERLF